MRHKKKVETKVQVENFLNFSLDLNLALDFSKYSIFTPIFGVGVYIALIVLYNIKNFPGFYNDKDYSNTYDLPFHVVSNLCRLI